MRFPCRWPISPASQRNELPRRLPRVLLRPQLYSPTSSSPPLWRNSIRSGCFLARSCSSARDLLEPLCLLFFNPSIHRRGIVAYEELLAAAVGSGLLWKLIPVAATHCIARSHRPFDFVWRFTVWTNGTLLYFSQSLGRPFDLDASFAVGTVDVLGHSVPLTPALIDDQLASTGSLAPIRATSILGSFLIRCCYYKWPPSN